MMHTVAVVSGGMDSTVLAYVAARRGEVTMVSFDYGQRHRKELAYAAKTAHKLSAEHIIVPMSFLGPLVAGSSSLVTADVAVPDGHYAQETMRATVVPNRNSIMANIAAGIAVARGANALALGVHAGDHFIYPDCRPAFIELLDALIQTGNEGFTALDFHVWAPFVNITKADIARIGDEIGVPWGDTWSCYRGGEIHCGACGTCFERREAFKLAGVFDPTEYAATPEYEAP